MGSQVYSNESVYSVTGTLHPHLSVKVGPQVQGRVLEVLVEVGDSVEKGQVLAKLDARLYENALKKCQTYADLAKASYEQAELEFKRHRHLWEKQGENPAISRKTFEDSEFMLTQKKLIYEQTLHDLEMAEIQLAEASIRAPFSGIVTARYLDPGEAVTAIPPTPVVEVMDISSLRFEFSLPQNLVKKVHPGTPIRSTEEFIGTIEKVFPSIDPLTRSFTCRVILDNTSKSLKPGAFLSAQLHLE